MMKLVTFASLTIPRSGIHRSAAGLHLLYLQLRQNLLENSLDVSSNQVVQLSSLALLAEFGGRSDKVRRIS